MDPHIANDPHKYGGLKKYTVGFLLCVALSLASFLIGIERIFTGGAFTIAISVLAIAQAIVQLILFLHLGDEEKPRLNTLIFLFMALVLVVIVFGSLWIMSNLNYQMMPHHGQ